MSMLLMIKEITLLQLYSGLPGEGGIVIALIINKRLPVKPSKTCRLGQISLAPGGISQFAACISTAFNLVYTDSTGIKFGINIGCWLFIVHGVNEATADSQHIKGV